MAPSNGRARKMKSVESLSRLHAADAPVKHNLHPVHNVNVPTHADIAVASTTFGELGPISSVKARKIKSVASLSRLHAADTPVKHNLHPVRNVNVPTHADIAVTPTASGELGPISSIEAQNAMSNLGHNIAEANVATTIENDIPETNNIAQDCQGSTSTNSNAVTSLSRKIYVLPSHLRSSRKSRSTYRQFAYDESQDNNENGSTGPIVIDSTLPEISSVIRHSFNRALRSHNPASCRPKRGEDPFPIFWVAGTPVGDYACKFANYCGEEAKRYDKFPLHERWNETQANYARSIFRNAQIKKDYIFLGEEDPEHEGHRLPVDQRLAERHLVFTIQDIKKDWRSTIKKDYWEAWDAGDFETRKAIENSLDSRIPLVHWLALCAYFGSAHKMDEAKCNSENQRSTKRPRLTCTLGRKKQIHAYYDMQKKEGSTFNIAKAFIKCHKTLGTEDQYPNEQTKEYCEQFDVVVQDMPICPQSSFSVLSTITDKVSGGHHGGYERGLGRAFSRKLHLAAEKSPMISVCSSKDEQIAALTNRVKELESKEVQR